MAEIKDRMATLPDEVLMQIFHHLPSLRDKLRVESVSRRFQRCLVELLNTHPIPFEYGIESRELNGHNVLTDLSKVVQALAKKAKFSSISLGDHVTNKQIRWILGALVRSVDCLDRVTVLQISCRLVTKWTVLEKALDKCTKLSDVRLCGNFYPRDLQNLGLALSDKTVTRISISLPLPPFHNQQQPLIQLYRSLKPNTLKTTSLSLYGMPLDVDVFMTELCGGAWAAVEEIEFDWRKMDLDTNELFSSISQLPALRKCKIYLSVTGEQNLMVDALNSLFSNQTEVTLSCKYIDFDGHNWPVFGCQIVALIRQVQAVHPDLQVDFVGPCARELILTLGSVRFGPELQYYQCDWDCTDCHIFYPTLIVRLYLRAYDRARGIQQDVHLANARLDRCRVEAIVAHLNHHRLNFEIYEALHAEMNEAQDLATIAFEGQQVGMFQITVDCGRCLTIGCFGCIHVG